MAADEYRIDVISDTHGYLAPRVLDACDGADLIVHAGDICGDDILTDLEVLAPVVAVLGNNDWPGQYGPNVQAMARFTRCGITFKVVHIPTRLGELDARVCICGHTHRASVEQVGATTIVNPGSVSKPRDAGGPSMARIILTQDFVKQVQILRLDDLDRAGSERMPGVPLR